MKPPKIIYEDKSLVVLDKPAGWIVNDASTTKDQPVAEKWLQENFSYPLIGDREKRSGIVHRLDKETSGLLLVAKTSECFDFLQKQFKERNVKKTYVALVHGNLEQESGLINAEVGRLPWRKDRFGVLPGGRSALTRYSVIKKYLKDGEPLTLLEVNPETGRTHQIRIHLKFINHPVVGDLFYAGRKTAKKDRLWCPRLFLHAKGIVFIHPETKKTVEFQSQIPEELNLSQSSLHGI